MLFLKENPMGFKDKKAMQEFNLSKEEQDMLAIKNDKYN